MTQRKISLLYTRPDLHWVPPSPLYNGYRGSFPGQSDRGLALTICLSLAMRLGMNWAISTLSLCVSIGTSQGEVSLNTQVYSIVASGDYIVYVFWLYLLWYDMFVNCNWVATRWQQFSTYLHTNNTQNDTKQTIHRTTQKFWKTAGRAPSLRVLPWHLPCNRGKSTEKPRSG
jgi:hypothetical protein